MKQKPSSAPVIPFPRPVVATIRRERSAWRPEFSPVKTHMISTVSAIGLSWLATSDVRQRATEN